MGVTIEAELLKKIEQLVFQQMFVKNVRSISGTKLGQNKFKVLVDVEYDQQQIMKQILKDIKEKQEMNIYEDDWEDRMELLAEFAREQNNLIL